MKRKSIISSIVVAGMGFVSSASALPVQHAVTFRALNASEESSLVFSTNGVANASSSPKDVVGTIARDPDDVFGGARVTVIGFHESDGNTLTTNCTVYAVTPPAADTQIPNTIVSKSLVATGNHTWTRTAKFDAVQVSAKTSFFIRCTLAANQKARITSVRIPSTSEPGGQLSEGEGPVL